MYMNTDQPAISTGMTVSWTGARDRRQVGTVLRVVTDSPATGDYAEVVTADGARYCLHPAFLAAV